MYNLSILTNVRDEDFWLHEFLAYYMVLGVNHFYIYDHCSKTAVKDILKNFEDVCTIKNAPEHWKKHDMREDWLQNHKNETKWILLVDCDEFVVPKEDIRLDHFINEFDDKKNYADEVALNQRFFGSNGVKKRQRGMLQIDTFTKCYKKPVDSIKVFVRSSKWKCDVHPHFACLESGGIRRDGLGRIRDEESQYIGDNGLGNRKWARNPRGEDLSDKIEIHHYAWRTLEDIKIKWSRITDDTHKLRPVSWEKAWQSSLFNSQHENKSAVKFADKVRLLLKSRGCLDFD